MIVAVASAALRTPLGSDLGAVAARLLAGEGAARASPLFDAAAYRCSLGAAIGEAPASSRHRRFLDRLGLHALSAGLEALAKAGVRAGDPRLERTGLFVGTPGLRPRWDEMPTAFAEPAGAGPWAAGLRKLHPFWMLQHLSNNVHALLSMEAGITGEGATFGGGVAGAEALLAATRALHAGAVDLALVVAYDSLLAPEVLVDLAARTITAECSLEELRPAYDEHASGAVPGEAAAALVLARPGERAAEQGLVEVVTGVDPTPLASGEPRAALVAELASRVSRGERMVDGAAWAVCAQDDAERRELAQLLDPRALLTATSAAFGKLGAAAAVVQVAVWLELLRRRSIPPIAGLRRASPGPLSPLSSRAGALGQSALLLSTAAPGLACAVRVQAD